MALTTKELMIRASKAFDQGFKHGWEDRTANNRLAEDSIQYYSETYILGYNKGYEGKYYYLGGKMTKEFDKGERVNTPNVPGTIIYKRMASSGYTVAAYSVCLDSRKAESELPPFPFYAGTIFPAEQVTE